MRAGYAYAEEITKLFYSVRKRKLSKQNVEPNQLLQKVGFGVLKGMKNSYSEKENNTTKLDLITHAHLFTAVNVGMIILI